jgi:NTP pyrophosphatase (non-canonical NTP hydrolase)
MQLSERVLAVVEEAHQVWGLECRGRVAIEEMAELTKELCKVDRYGRSPERDALVVDEVADVLITMASLAIVYGEPAVEQAVERKLARLADRLDVAKAAKSRKTGG